MKILFSAVGVTAVLLALLGIFLPLLPTTPFLLIASACFVRGSERLHRWLLENRLFGEYLRNIEEKRGIPRKSKAVALCLMWVSLGISIWTVQPLPLKAMLVVIGMGVTLWVLRMKTLGE